MLTSDLVDMSWSNNENLEYLRGVNSITEREIDSYVEILFRDVAEKLEVKFRDIKDILYGRNIAFFEKKARLFKENECMNSGDYKIESLMEELQLPYVSYPYVDTTTKRFLRDFKTLPLKQKVEIINKISTFRVDMAYDNTVEIGINRELGSSAEVKSFISQFNQLDEIEKTLVLESLLKLDINILEDE